MKNLISWLHTKVLLDQLQIKEKELRTQIFKENFPEPKEGINKKEVGDYLLKTDYKLNRTLDIAVLTQHWEDFKEEGINMGRLIKSKPELVLSEYRKLTEEKQNIFNICLTVRPGLPQISIKELKND